MTHRREFPKSVRLQAFQRAGGRCEDCTGFLRPGHYHFDHDLADGLGGKPSLDNCKVRCDFCHGIKTHQHDNPKMNKADRAREKIVFGKKRKWSRPILGSRRSGLRKRMDGTVERR